MLFVESNHCQGDFPLTSYHCIVDYFVISPAQTIVCYVLLNEVEHVWLNEMLTDIKKTPKQTTIYEVAFIPGLRLNQWVWRALPYSWIFL